MPIPDPFNKSTPLAGTLVGTLVALVTGLVALAPATTRAAPGPRPGAVGTKARPFDLRTIPGPKISLRSLRGHKVVLVVGISQASAPHCKRWMKPLLERYGTTAKAAVQVYQVVVVDKSWYIPKALVLHKLKGFIGPRFHYRFLIEWHLGFAKAYSVVKSSDPNLLVIDERGVIRWRLRDRYTKARWRRLIAAIEGPQPAPTSAASR